MKRTPRIHYTETQRALMWDRWQKGDSMHDIARLFDRTHPAIHRILTLNGVSLPERKSGHPLP